MTRPPRTMTMECSCKLWPTPGMYAVTSMPLESRTRAIFRKAEFGFFGVVVVTLMHTPRLNGLPLSNVVLFRFNGFNTVCKAGVLDFHFDVFRGFRISWLSVGMEKKLTRSPSQRKCSGGSESCQNKSPCLCACPDWEKRGRQGVDVEREDYSLRERRAKPESSGRRYTQAEHLSRMPSMPSRMVCAILCLRSTRSG